MPTEREMRKDQIKAALVRAYERVNEDKTSAALNAMEEARLILLSNALLEEHAEMRAERARAELKEMGCE